MAVINCPNCPTTLRVPDGASGHARCPQCQTKFPIPSAAAADAPAPQPLPPEPDAKSSPQAKPQPKPQAQPQPKPEPAAPKFEVVEEPNPKKPKFEVVDDGDATDEEDDADDDVYVDDQGRTRMRRKSRRRDDDEDEDNDDEQPRRKTGRSSDRIPARKKARRRYEDEDEDDFDDEVDERPGKGRRASSKLLKERGQARLGMLLVSIGSWLYVGLYALFTMGAFLLLIGVLSASSEPKPRAAAVESPLGSETIASIVNGMLILIGLVGLANWLISIVGLGFCIGGPDGTRAPAITATAVSGVHLLMVGVCYVIASDLTKGVGAMTGLGSFAWALFATNMPWINSLLPALIYMSRGLTTEYFLLILTGVLEAVRIIVVLGSIKSLAESTKNNAGARRAQLGMITTASVLGGGVVISLLVMVMLRGTASPRTMGLLTTGWLFLISLGYTVMLLFPAVAAGSARQSLAKKTR